MTVQGHDRWLYVHFKGNDHDRTIIYFLFDLTRKPVKNILHQFKWREPLLWDCCCTSLNCKIKFEYLVLVLTTKQAHSLSSLAQKLMLGKCYVKDKDSHLQNIQDSYTQKEKYVL